jgi:hypothetical protein
MQESKSHRKIPFEKKVRSEIDVLKDRMDNIEEKVEEIYAFAEGSSVRERTPRGTCKVTDMPSKGKVSGEKWGEKRFHEAKASGRSNEEKGRGKSG